LPLYAYRCTQCGYSFEKIQHFNAQPELECPKCHGVLKRPLTAPAFRFKGSGWYVNDYGGKNAAVTSEPAPVEAKPAACAGKCAACPAAAAAGTAAS
jgi:putative FmdB family regulatory protein